MEIYFWGMNLRRNDEYLATGKTWTLKALPMIRMMIYATMILILGDSIDKNDHLWIQKPWPVEEIVYDHLWFLGNTGPGENDFFPEDTLPRMSREGNGVVWCWTCTKSDSGIDIWRCPEMGIPWYPLIFHFEPSIVGGYAPFWATPKNHSFLDGIFPKKNHPLFGVSPVDGTSHNGSPVAAGLTTFATSVPSSGSTANAAKGWARSPMDLLHGKNGWVGRFQLVMGVPQKWLDGFWENPIVRNGWRLGVPLFQETSIWTYLNLEHLGIFHKWGYPNSWMVYFMDNLLEMDDLGLPWLWKHMLTSQTTQHFHRSTHPCVMTSSKLKAVTWCFFRLGLLMGSASCWCCCSTIAHIMATASKPPG